MTKISKIYESTNFLFKVGSRKGKTRKQINEMIDRQRPKKKVKKNKSIKKKPKSRNQVDLYNESVTLSNARKILNVGRKRLDNLLAQGHLKICAGTNLELRVTTDSIKYWLKNANRLESIPRVTQTSNEDDVKVASINTNVAISHTDK